MKLTLGQKIKQHRKDKGMTQQKLADEAQISRSYLGDIEGDRYEPSLNTLKLIANALSLNPAIFIDNEKDKRSNAAALSPKEERDVARDLEKLLLSLESNAGMAYYDGEPMDEESKELLRISLENSMRLAKQIAKKKFTPKKYRD